MGTFSAAMRQVAKDLCKELGNRCTLTKVTKGAYNADLGESPETKIVINTFSAQMSQYAQNFGLSGNNVNLSGMNQEQLIIPWFGQPMDKTWLYNDQNIVDIAETMSQDDIIIYTITVGEKM